MILNISDRLLLLELLEFVPFRGNVIQLRAKRDLIQLIGIDEKEAEKIELKINGNDITWDNDKAESRDFDIGMQGYDVVKRILQTLNNAEDLASEHLDLWERFMEADDGVDDVS